MNVLWAPDAVADLQSAVEYLAERSPQAAVKLAGRVFEAISHLTAGDFEGPEQRLKSGELVRSWPVPPMRIYYQRGTQELRVLRVYHQARRPIAE